MIDASKPAPDGAPEPLKFAAAFVEIPTAAIASDPVAVMAQIFVQGYRAGAKHGGAPVNVEAQTSPLEPDKLRLHLVTDIPDGVPLLATTVQRAIELACTDHDVMAPDPACGACSLRVDLTIAAPREQAVQIQPVDPDEAERADIRRKILGR